MKGVVMVCASLVIVGLLASAMYTMTIGFGGASSDYHGGDDGYLPPDGPSPMIDPAWEGGASSDFPIDGYGPRIDPAWEGGASSDLAMDGYGAGSPSPSGGGSEQIPGDEYEYRLTAGDFDDTLNYRYYLDFVMDKQDSWESQALFSNRVVFHVVDKFGNGVSNAMVTITEVDDDRVIFSSYTGTDGYFYLFPEFDGLSMGGSYVVSFEVNDSPNAHYDHILDLSEAPEQQNIEIVLQDYKNRLPKALDLVFVIDTTGSMGDELSYLTEEFTRIVADVREQFPTISIHFGLVVYRDVHDEYVVRSYQFTGSLSKMQDRFDTQVSNGGGDYPEAVEQGLASAIDLQWREGNVARMMFLVGDAPPHTQNIDRALDEMHAAREKGIHVFPIAASGVDNVMEYVMRTAGVLSDGRYLFLTDDSGIGSTHAEPHIPAYYVTTLRDSIVRSIESELTGLWVEPH
ncbi:MAG: VWA domain-containing protein, partial [Gammaproteobacteria bacterium]|nr:VWA domain-containing protein [Gammaproteobacteria bacterium]